MKNYINNSLRFCLILIFLISFFVISCEQRRIIPPELIGQWKTGNITITVRTKPERGKYDFISDTATITLNIDSNYTVSGFIGSAEFESRIIRASAKHEKERGYAYTIKPFAVGKIFPNDPKEDKSVYFLLYPIEGTTFKFKSRLKNLGFTMAEIELTKEE